VKIWKGVLMGILTASLIISSLFVYFTYGSGTLVIEMMDPPEYWGSASHVYIHYSEIKIHRADAEEESGWHTVIEDDRWLNLTSVVNVSKAIGQSSLQAGKYNIIRFNITEAIVTVNGENHTVTVVNGRLNIPITRGGIRVDAGQKTYLVIDITPRITGSQQGFRLVPATRAIPGAREVG